jgi:hypothetical protein
MITTTNFTPRYSPADLFMALSVMQNVVQNIKMNSSELHISRLVLSCAGDHFAYLSDIALRYSKVVPEKYFLSRRFKNYSYNHLRMMVCRGYLKKRRVKLYVCKWPYNPIRVQFKLTPKGQKILKHIKMAHSLRFLPKNV